MSKRRVLPRLACLVVALITLLRGVEVASAHAIVVRTDPVDGAVLAEAPDQVRVWFSERVLLNFTTIELVDGNGRPVPLAAARLDPDDPNALVIDLPDLAPNAYRLTWRTLASDDLHTTSGSLVFGVQQAAPPASAAPVAIAPQPSEVALRWLNFGGLAGLLGALALALIVVPEVGAPDAPIVTSLRRRLLWLALGASTWALIAGGGLLLIQAEAVGPGAASGSAWQILTQTEYGTRWLLREGQLMALASVVVVILFRLRETDSLDEQHATLRAARLAVTPLVFALLIMQALSSHVAGLNDASPVSVLADALHLLAAGGWAGGLFALAIVVVPVLRRDRAAALGRAILRRFGGLAALGLAVLAITGLYAGGQLVASLDALMLTLYGQALLLKIGLMIGVGLIGLSNAALLHPRVADVLRRVLHRPAGWTPFASRHLWRTVLTEAVGASAIVLFAALLSATPPARGPEFDPPLEEATAPPTLSDHAGDLFITLSIKPNRPGQNFVLLGVYDTRRPAPAPIDSVTVRLLAPGAQDDGVTLVAESSGKGNYQAAVGSINTPGAWQVAVIVSRPGLVDTVLTTPWTVMPLVPPVARRPVLISNQPLAPLLTLIAGGLAGLLCLALGGLWLRRRIKPAARLDRGSPPRVLQLVRDK